MKASIVDLRYNMKEVLTALSRNEKVKIYYHGKAKGVIVPTNEVRTKSVMEHPFYGMNKASKESVKTIMRKLRDGRFTDI